MKKVSTGIKKVTIDSPVFSGEVFEPTLINFFFGKNGTGKSTIAKEMGKSGSVEWCADNQGESLFIMKSTFRKTFKAMATFRVYLRLPSRMLK